MKLVAHSRPNCEMIVLEEGPSHAHDVFGSLQMPEFEVHVVVWLVQCHVG